LDIWPLDWDAMQGAERAVWRATQAIRNTAARPSPARQMVKLLMNEPLASPWWASGAVGASSSDKLPLHDEVMQPRVILQPTLAA
jgi:hypothetical protein